MTDQVHLGDDGEQVVVATAATASTDWEKAYKGLQKVVDKLKRQLDEANTKFDTLNEEHETLKLTLRGKDGEVSGMQAQLAELQAGKASSESELASYRIQAERTKMILSEFPELSQFEADGLLPSADSLDNLRPKLEKFKATLSSKVGTAFVEKMAGTTPATSTATTAPGKRSKEVVYNQLQRLAGSRDPKDRAEYETLLAEWDELN